MPNRIIKESYCYSDDIDKLSSFEETVFIRLLVNCDDYGRIDARIGFLKSRLFSTKNGITDKNIEDAVSKLASVGLVQLYTVDEKPFLQFPKWDKHQTIRAKKSKYPSPKDGEIQSHENICKQMQADVNKCLRNPIQSESNPNPNTNTNTNTNTKDAQDKPAPCPSFKKPTVAQIAEYCLERRNSVDAQQFFDYYESNGWQVGKNAMKNWQASVRSWEKRSFENSAKTTPSDRASSYDLEVLDQFWDTVPVLKQKDT